MSSWAEPGDLITVVRAVPGGQWIECREELEQVWWREALAQLDERLREFALLPGVAIVREVALDEIGREVRLLVETRARAPERPGMTGGLPLLVLQTPPPPCPPGGDALLLPAA